LKQSLKNIAVIGPNANDTEILLGNYNGEPAHVISPLEGIQNKFTNSNILYAKGCNVIDTPGYDKKTDYKEAIEMAQKAEVVIFVGGISPRLEGEDLKVKVPGFLGGDKTDLNLPTVQTELLMELKKLGKPIVLVLLNGSALSINWEQKELDAIVETWYGGEKGGEALADVLAGDYNPAGRLPVTFYKSVTDIPKFDDYSMQGRTYRYLTKPVLYPFGYGLSYTKFAYSNLKLSAAELNSSKPLTISLNVKNTGDFNGDEVVQLYIKQFGSAMPVKELKGFKRVNIKKGEQQTVTFKLDAKDITHYNEATKEMETIRGKLQILVGKSSGTAELTANITLK
ncbi:MAG: glycosyl hydrolase, partial [Pedobacter sp.]